MNRLRSIVERLEAKRWFLPVLIVSGLLSAGVLIAIVGGAVDRLPGNQIVKTDPAPPASLPPLGPDIDARLIDPKNGSKFSYLYLKLFSAYSTGGQAAAEAEARSLGILDDSGVHAVLILKSPYTDDLGARLKSAGIVVDKWADNQVVVTFPASRLAEVQTSHDFSFIQGVLSVDEIVDIQAPQKLPTSFLAPGDPGFTVAAGRTVSAGPTEGIQRTGADKWHAANIRGAGVEVGIIDSFAGYKEVLGKYLPANVTANDFTGQGFVPAQPKDYESVHGTAVAQVIHEMAPDAQLYLAQAGESTELLAAVNWLMDQRVDVISLSLGDFINPPDGNSPMAKKLEQARAAGIFVASSAGNYASNNFVGTTSGKADYVTFGSDNRNFLQAFGNGGAVFLNWASPDANLALLTYDEAGKVKLGETRRQKATEPTGLGLLFPKDAKVYNVAVVQLSGPPTQFRVIYSGRQQNPYFGSAFMSTNANTASRGALSVAAADVETDKIVDYSSWGPTMDGRFKPEIAAPTNVSSYYYKDIGGFNGTSAAAPHVAGAAALVKSKFPNYKADDIQKFLLANAREITVPDATVGTFANGLGRLQLPDPSTLR